MLGLVVGVLAVGGAALAGGDQAGTGVLTVYVSGPSEARVTVTPAPELPSDRHPCFQKEPDEDDEPCVYTLPQGPVTLVASPTDAFLRWSEPACGSNPVCETTVEPCESPDEQWLCGPIVATFAPVKLILRVSGPGTATVTPVGGVADVPCGPGPPDPTDETVCVTTYPTITEVEIKAEPSMGTTFAWGNAAFCDPDPTNPALCHAEVNFDPTNVGLGFHPALPSENFEISITLRVVRGGAGSGSVTGVRRDGTDGEIINCGSDCSQELDYAKRVVLTAHPDADSTFVGWTGVCSTDPTCAFSAGAVTRVRAVFGKKQAPPPPPPPPSPPQPPPPPRTAFSARILGVSVVRTRAARVVVARMRLNEAAAGRAQVRRGRRALAGRALGLRAGRSLVRLPLRARVRRGRALFAITLRSSTGRTRSLTARFTIPRRR